MSETETLLSWFRMIIFVWNRQSKMSRFWTVRWTFNNQFRIKIRKSGLSPINKIINKILIIWTQFSDFWKVLISKLYSIKNRLNIVQLAAPKFIRKFVRFFRENLEDSNSEDFFWEFVDRVKGAKKLLKSVWRHLRISLFWCYDTHAIGACATDPRATNFTKYPGSQTKGV